MINGMCHCGAVRWRLDGTPDHATSCNCTMCRRTGALWAYGHDGVDVHVTAAEGALSGYQHGDRSLTLHFCRRCGNVTHWRGAAPGTDGRTRAAVNLRLAEPAAVAAIPLHRFDGFASWTSLPDDGRTLGAIWP